MGDFLTAPRGIARGWAPFGLRGFAFAALERAVAPAAPEALTEAFLVLLAPARSAAGVAAAGLSSPRLLFQVRLFLSLAISSRSRPVVTERGSSSRMSGS